MFISTVSYAPERIPILSNLSKFVFARQLLQTSFAQTHYTTRIGSFILKVIVLEFLRSPTVKGIHDRYYNLKICGILSI